MAVPCRSQRDKQLAAFDCARVNGCPGHHPVLAKLFAVALLADMLVAIVTTKLSAVPKGLSPLNWLDDFLYLPEVLYVLFFIWLICSGPGRLSVDYWLAGKS